MKVTNERLERLKKEIEEYSIEKDRLEKLKETNYDEWLREFETDDDDNWDDLDF